MKINRVWGYFGKGCLIGLAIVFVYCLLDNPHLILLLFSQDEIINQVAIDSQKVLDIPFGLFRTFLMILLQYVLFKNFQHYFFLCMEHNNNFENLKSFGLKRCARDNLSINDDFRNFGIFMVVYTASIPLVIIKVVQIWGGFIPAI